MDESGKAKRLSAAQTFLVHVSEENARGAVSLLSPTITFRIPGNSMLSGVFSGRSEVMDHLSALTEATHGTFDLIQWEDWMQGDQHISVLAKVQMQRKGRVLDAHFVILMRFDREDGIDELDVFADDQNKVDLFFA